MSTSGDSAALVTDANIPSSTLPAIRSPLSGISSYSKQQRTSPTLPLPSLPIELKRHILAFTDTRTLVVCSCASLAFLEISSAFLYRDVELVGLDRLNNLFCSRSKTSSPLVDAHLSLSRIKTFSLVATSGTFFDYTLHSDRIVGATLDVEVLTVKIDKRPHVGLTTTVTPLLLPLFNPSTFAFIALGVGRPAPLRLEPSSLAVWTRLRHLRLVEDACLHWEDPIDTTYFVSSSWRLTYELPNFPRTPTTEQFWIMARTLVWKARKENFPNEVVREAEVVVRTEEERRWAEEFLREAALDELGERGADERMKRISVVARDLVY